MSTALTISEVGLRLIKAYEGFRAVDVELVSGQRVAGYGHRVMSGESLHLSEKQAEKLLKRDLAPFEAMINDSIYAPLSQSQFDALCSLAYNIGPKKFLESDVVRALNNGRVLDAANGFDVWRKGQINGESFVVDALVRRRTAEKVLFLRPSLRAVRAPRVDLETAADDTLIGVTTAAPARVFEDSGFVPTVNYEAASDGIMSEEIVADMDVNVSNTDIALAEPIEDIIVERRVSDSPIIAAATPMRRRDDKPGGVLTLSEIIDDENEPTYDFDDSFDPLIKDVDGFELDINSDAERAEMAITADSEPTLVLTDIADDEGFDPSDYIVGESDDKAQTDDDVLDLIERDAEPSPIAAAAADVSARLDALMAKRDENAPDARSQTDRKVLPFRAKSSTSDPDKLRQENPLYGSLMPARPISNGGDEPVLNGLGKAQSTSANALKDAELADSKFKETAVQKDSAARYIASTIAPAQTQTPNTGLSVMIIIGMIMLAVSVATMLSGFDQRFGPGGEFLSTVGALIGLMITLGSIYYILKNMRSER